MATHSNNTNELKCETYKLAHRCRLCGAYRTKNCFRSHLDSFHQVRLDALQDKVFVNSLFSIDGTDISRYRLYFLDRDILSDLIITDKLFRSIKFIST